MHFSLDGRSVGEHVAIRYAPCVVERAGQRCRADIAGIWLIGRVTHGPVMTAGGKDPR
jgi:hypothetical protein